MGMVSDLGAIEAVGAIAEEVLGGNWKVKRSFDVRVVDPDVEKRAEGWPPGDVPIIPILAPGATHELGMKPWSAD